MHLQGWKPNIVEGLQHVGALKPTWEGPFETKDDIIHPGTFVLIDL